MEPIDGYNQKSEDDTLVFLGVQKTKTLQVPTSPIDSLPSDNLRLSKEVMLYRISEIMDISQDPRIVNVLIDAYAFVNRSLYPTNSFTRRIDMALASKQKGVPVSLLLDLREYLSIEPSEVPVKKAKLFSGKKVLVAGIGVSLVILAIAWWL